MSTEHRVIEVDHDSGHLEILALTQTGSWDAILTLDPNTAEVVSRYRMPLLLRFGYSHAFQSDIPQAESDMRGVMPHDSRPLQS